MLKAKEIPAAFASIQSYFDKSGQLRRLSAQTPQYRSTHNQLFTNELE